MHTYLFNKDTLFLVKICLFAYVHFFFIYYASPWVPYSVTVEGNCFPHCQLTFSFDRLVIAIATIIWKVFEYIPKSILSICLCVCTTIYFIKRDFIFIINLSCYTSMDSSQWALQTNGKLVLNVELIFEILAENQKTFKKIAELWILIKMQWICLK